ncbi:MAG: MFS transporter, partial [Candidatus Bathyarchaeales archaeon]
MFTRFQWVMLILSFLASLTAHLLLFSYSQLKELIALEMGLTYAEAGFVFSLSVFALVVLRIPWGFVIDKLGVRVSAGLALTLLGIFSFLRGFAVNYATLLLFQLLMGVGLAAVMPCLPKLVAGFFPSEKTVFAIGASISGFAIGDVIALSGTPYLLRFLGDWRNVFYVYGAWAIILTLFWWIFSRGLSQKRETGSSSSMGKDLTALLRNRQVWLLSGLYFCSGACYDTLLVWLPSIADAWLATSMLPLGFLAASFVIGPLSDRAGLRKPFILLLGLFAGPAIYSIVLLSETA